MSIVASDLIIYNSLNMPDVDGSTTGGAIDTLRRPDFTQLAANDDIEAVSSNSADTTQNVTIEARDSSGTIVSETKTLTGTTPVVFSVLGVVERVLKVEMSASCAGNVTVRRSPSGAALRIIPAGERGFLAFTRKGASDPSLVISYYAKVFCKNTNGVNALQNTTFRQGADPDARVTHLPANAVNDAATSANRQTAPNASFTLDPDIFDDSDKLVGTLAPGSAWGIWLRVQLPAADTAHNTTYSLNVTGVTT